MSEPLILYSRSAVVQDWKCPRARYWNYEYAGRGITPADTALELYLGQVIHDGLAAIAMKVDIDEIVEAGTTQLRLKLLEGQEDDHDAQYFAMEQASLAEGLLRGFHRVVWPSFSSQYPEVVSVEEEATYRHDGLTFMAKPDLIVRDTEGSLWYVEYKTTSSNKDQWINSWSTAVQLHSSVRAVEASLGEKVTGVIVQGLYKGYVSYDKQNSPFCYAYYKPGEPPFTKEVWSYEYKPGLKKQPVWMRAGGVREWVNKMPIDLLKQQFPQVPPIFINDHLVDAFFKQRAVREHQIREAWTHLMRVPNDTTALDMNFPQHFEQCNPGWGKGCSYRKLCHGLVRDPLELGYELRHSHHEMEEKALNAVSE